MTQAIHEYYDRLAPDYDLAYLTRARGYAQMRDWEKCLNDADAALKITPMSEWGHYLRGQALTEPLRSSIPYTTHGDGLSHLAAFARTLHPRPKPPRRGRPPRD